MRCAASKSGCANVDDGEFPRVGAVADRGERVRAMHGFGSMTPAAADEIAELLGESAEESIVERIAHVGASVEEISEAIDDLDFQARFGEVRTPATPAIKEVRSILEELPAFEELVAEAEDEDDEGLTVISADDLFKSEQ